MRPHQRLTVIMSVLSVGVAAFAVAEAIHVVAIRRYDSLAPICRVSTDRPVVALTFDDGPDAAITPDVVTLLRRYHDQATFFLIGSRAEAFAELVREESAAGMEVGNHTWTHPHLPALSTAQTAMEIERMQDKLVGSTGVAPQLFRAPFGLLTPDELRSVATMGLSPCTGRSRSTTTSTSLHSIRRKPRRSCSMTSVPATSSWLTTPAMAVSIEAPRWPRSASSCRPSIVGGST